MFPITEHYQFREIFENPQLNLPEVEDEYLDLDDNKFWYHGMHALIDNDWVIPLSDWLKLKINDSVISGCYEVMAGRGWLAKALDMAGVEIEASDSGCNYEERLTLDLPTIITEAVYYVENQMAGTMANQIKEYINNDPTSRFAVIICYPPDTSDAYDFVTHLPKNTFIIYIGDEEFHFTADENFKESITWLHQHPTHTDYSQLNDFPYQNSVQGVHANKDLVDAVIWLGVV